jgi:hypothetical protein
MVNIDFTAILDDLAGEWTDPAACDDPATTFVCKPNPCCRLSNQRLCTAVLAGFKRVKSPIVFGSFVPAALWRVAQATVGLLYEGRIGRNTEQDRQY